MKFLLTLFLLLAFTCVNAQPSTSTNFAFKLYSKGEQIVNYQLIKEYKVKSRNDFELNKFQESYSGYTSIYLGAIYPPFIFSICNKKDTMTIYIMDDHSEYLIDSLPFKHGTFVIPPNSNDQTPITLNFKKFNRNYQPIQINNLVKLPSNSYFDVLGALYPEREFEFYVEKVTHNKAEPLKDSLINLNNYYLKWTHVEGTYGGSPYYGGKAIKSTLEIDKTPSIGLPLLDLPKNNYLLLGDKYLIIKSEHSEPQPTSNIHYIYITRYYEKKE